MFHLFCFFGGASTGAVVGTIGTETTEIGGTIAIPGEEATIRTREAEEIKEIWAFTARSRIKEEEEEEEVTIREVEEVIIREEEEVVIKEEGEEMATIRMEEEVVVIIKEEVEVVITRTTVKDGPSKVGSVATTTKAWTKTCRSNKDRETKDTNATTTTGTAITGTTTTTGTIDLSKACTTMMMTITTATTATTTIETTTGLACKRTARMTSSLPEETTIPGDINSKPECPLETIKGTNSDGKPTKRSKTNLEARKPRTRI